MKEEYIKRIMELLESTDERGAKLVYAYLRGYLGGKDENR